MSSLKDNNQVLNKFINLLMKDGKKFVAEKIVLNTFKEIEKATSEDPFTIFLKAIENVKPSVELKSRRIAGKTYQVPIELNAKRQLTLAIKWIIQVSSQRNESTMSNRLTSELLNAFDNRGAAVKKKEDLHRMAQANRAFAHFRW